MSKLFFAATLALGALVFSVQDAAAQTVAVEEAGENLQQPLAKGSTLNDEMTFLQEEGTVSVATKTNIPVSKAPGAVSLITYEQIQNSGARTVPELMRMVPGGNVRWGPMMETVDVRGFGENPFTNRMLLLIDGVPYNSWEKGGFPEQPGFDFIPIEIVKQIEVIRGPGAALYGENAYWGVINIVTLSGADVDGARADVLGGGGRGKPTLTSALQYGTTWKDDGKEKFASTTFPNGSLLMSANLQRSQFPTQLWRDSGSAVTAGDLFIKASFEDLQLSYFRHSDNTDGFREVLPAGSFGPGSQATNFQSAAHIQQDVDIVAIKYNHAPKGEPVSFGADISYMQRDGSHCSACHNSADTTMLQAQPHGYQVLGDFHVGIQAIPNNDILIGTEFKRLDALSHSREMGPPVGGTVVDAYMKPAAYFQDQILMLDDKLRLTLGVRYDGETYPALFPSFFAPRIAAVYDAGDDVTLRASWGKARRIPSLSEMFNTMGFFSVTPNPFAPPGTPGGLTLSNFVPTLGLKPEEIQTYDTGMTFNVTRDFTVKTDLYYSQVSDFIVMAFDPQSNVSFQNFPDTGSILGGEFEANYRFSSQLTGYLNYAYQEEWQNGTRLDTSGKPMEFVYAPKNKVNIGIFFRPFKAVSGAFEVAWKDSYNTPSAWNSIQQTGTTTAIKQMGKQSGSALLNFKIGYELPFFETANDVRPIRVSFMIKNLLDQQPEETWVGDATSMHLVGRQLFGEVSYNF